MTATNHGDLRGRPRRGVAADRVDRRPSPRAFFLFTFVWSWVWWAVAGLAGVPVTQPPAIFLALVGGLGPLLATVVLVWRHYPQQARRAFWRRVWDPRLVGRRWWFVLVGAAAGPTVVGWLLTSGGDLTVGVTSTGAASVGVAAWLLFAAGAAAVEEPGWRGYALDALLERHTRLAASLLLGASWALWHLPQFFLAGTYQHDEVGFGTGLLWMFTLAIIAQTVLYVWIVTNTRGSILAAITFHALTNLAGETLDPAPAGELVALLLWAAAAVAVGIQWQRRDSRSTPGVDGRTTHPTATP